MKFLPYIVSVFLLNYCAAAAIQEKSADKQERAVTEIGPGYIGIIYRADPSGMRIVQVYPDSPGLRAGLRTNDLLISANEQALNGLSLSAFREMVLRMKPGSPLHLQSIRSGRIMKTTVILGTRPDRLIYSTPRNRSY